VRRFCGARHGRASCSALDPCCSHVPLSHPTLILHLPTSHHHTHSRSHGQRKQGQHEARAQRQERRRQRAQEPAQGEPCVVRAGIVCEGHADTQHSRAEAALSVKCAVCMQTFMSVSAASAGSACRPSADMHPTDGPHRRSELRVELREGRVGRAGRAAGMHVRTHERDAEWPERNRPVVSADDLRMDERRASASRRVQAALHRALGRSLAGPTTSRRWLDRCPPLRRQATLRRVQSRL
jgi:hypothetical protein